MKCIALLLLPLLLVGCSFRLPGQKRKVASYPVQRFRLLPGQYIGTKDVCTIGFGKHAWKQDPETGKLRSAVVLGDPRCKVDKPTAGVSPFGSGHAVDYVHTTGNDVIPVATGVPGIVLVAEYHDPREGDHDELVKKYGKAEAYRIHLSAWVELQYRGSAPTIHTVEPYPAWGNE